MSVTKTTAAETSPFWTSLPLPPGLRVIEEGAVGGPRLGPGGASVLTRARIVVPGGEAQVLFAYRPDAVARDIPALKSFLANAAEQLARKPSAEIVLQLSQTPLVGALATDAAPPSVIQACLRDGLGLIDRR